MKQSYKNVALFMALALTAAPALTGTAVAGTARGGSPLASTNDHASLTTQESPTADKTVEAQPMAGAVNIQPKVQADGTIVADPEANAKLHESMLVKKDVAKTNPADMAGSVDNGGAALAPGATPNVGGRVKLQSGAKDGSAK